MTANESAPTGRQLTRTEQHLLSTIMVLFGAVLAAVCHEFGVPIWFLLGSITGALVLDIRTLRREDHSA